MKPYIDVVICIEFCGVCSWMPFIEWVSDDALIAGC